MRLRISLHTALVFLLNDTVWIGRSLGFPTVSTVSNYGQCFCHPSSTNSVTSEDRIRNLCAQAVAATDDETLETILPQLKDALHEHVKNLRLTVAQFCFDKGVAAD